MAIKLIGNYAKRLGLPGYSSHQFSVSVETELTDSGDIQGEASRIYGLLQDAVDREIQLVGFVPGDEYGLTNGSGPSSPASNGNGHWSCSDKQKEFILKLVDEHDLDREVVEELALDRFSVGVKQLNKLQASGLIGELIELANARPRHGSTQGSSNGRNGHRAPARKGGHS
tara:strand:- start:59 stop:571 length:513 start_codon:yes stop_codon:yes gene_type:complete